MNFIRKKIIKKYIREGLEGIIDNIWTANMDKINFKIILWDGYIENYKFFDAELQATLSIDTIMAYPIYQINNSNINDNKLVSVVFSVGSFYSLLQLKSKEKIRKKDIVYNMPLLQELVTDMIAVNIYRSNNITNNYVAKYIGIDDIKYVITRNPGQNNGMVIDGIREVNVDENR